VSPLRVGDRVQLQPGQCAPQVGTVVEIVARHLPPGRRTVQIAWDDHPAILPYLWWREDGCQRVGLVRVTETEEA
jgi:hypothetical protein